MITTRVPEVTGAVAMYPYDGALEAKFAYRNRFGDTFNMAHREGARLFVPRECVPVGKLDQRLLLPELPAIDCQKPPRDAEQAKLIAESIAHLKAGRNHIFEASTGFGKTYCGSAIALAMRQPTLIVVTKEDLKQQWHNTLTKLIGIPYGDIGLVQQGKCDYEGKPFVITMVHSVIKEDNYPPELYKAFGMVLFDEVHRMGAETFEQACRLFPARYRLGLSATPERSDGKDPTIIAHIGPVLVRGRTTPMSPKVLVKPTKWVIPPYQKYNPNTGKMEYGRHMPEPDRMSTVYGLMGKDPARNKVITDFVLAAHRRGRFTVVMSHLIEGHLDILFLALTQAGLPGEDIAYYHGKAKAHERTRATTTARVVLATYAMTEEGTDVPHWDTLVLATPKANAKQAIGRVLRKLEGKPTPVVLDMVDQENIFWGFYRKREVAYYAAKGTIHKLP